MRDDLLAAKVRNEALSRELKDAKDKLLAAQEALEERQRLDDAERGEEQAGVHGTDAREGETESSRRNAGVESTSPARLQTHTTSAENADAASSSPFLAGIAIALVIVGGIIALALTTMGQDGASTESASAASEPMSMMMLLPILPLIVLIGGGLCVYFVSRSSSGKGRPAGSSQPDSHTPILEAFEDD